MTKPIRRVFSYIRFSSSEQSKGDSLRRQTDKTREWCARNGAVLDDSLSLRDLGVSAFKGDNASKGALKAFLDAVKEGRVEKGSILVIESLDRLTRNQVDDAYDLFRGILRAGVDIVTLTPEEHFTKESLRDIAKILTAIIYLSRAHEESSTKADRLASAWKTKRSKMGDRKMTAKCPGWLKLSEDRKVYLPIPERVAVVRDIFAWMLDGLGAHGIATKLNRDQVPPIGYAKIWHKSYVLKILNNRSVLGEYQPHTGHGARERKPIGPPIPDYYPAIVSEADFFRVQQLLDARRDQAGRHGETIANLFTGLVFDAWDHQPMVLIAKTKGCPYLVSSAGMRGVAGSKYLAFPYSAFEWAMISWTKEIKADDLMPTRPQGTRLQDQLAASEGRLRDIEKRVEDLKGRLKADEDFAALVDVLRELEAERRELAEKVNRLRMEVKVAENDTLGEAQGMAKLLDSAKGDELVDLRRRLKARFAALVSEIWVQVTRQSHWERQALVDVHFRQGGYRRLILLTNKSDLRSWGNVERKEGEPEWHDLRHQRKG